MSVVEYLFDYVDACGNTVYRNLVDWKNLFMHASMNSKLGVLKFLLSRQNEISASNVLAAHDYINWSAQNGLTALHVAAASTQGNPIEICKFLLQNGAILESDDSRCPSPFHIACTVGFLETVEFLHSSGATVNKRCEYTKDLCRKIRNRMPTVIPTLGTPLEFNAAWSFSLPPIPAVESRKIRKYLIDNGSEAPSNGILIGVATKDHDVDLLSVLSKLPVQYDHDMLPQSLFTESFRAGPREEPRIKTRMAHLLLDAGARPQMEDAARAAFFSDWYLTIRILAVVPDVNSQTWKATLLEAAILSCDLDTTKKAFELYPDQYSAGALCAAALVATRNGSDFGFVEALLNNRLGSIASGKQESYQEMAAIGIAAYSGNWELLQLLKRKLPWSHQAMVPEYNIYSIPGPRFEPLKLPDHYSDGFWYRYSLGPVQMFAAQAEERIFSLFVNQEFPLTAQCVVALILGDKAKQNRIWTWIQTGHRIHKGDDYSETDNPLHYAIDKHDISLVRACLELGANIDGYSTDPVRLTNTALVMAIWWGLSDIAGLLIDKGASVNFGSNYLADTPLVAASEVGQLGVVRMLLSIGANPNEPTNTPPAIRAARTPLEAAAKAGRLDVTHLLLVSGVNTEREGRLQYIRAISFASMEYHVQVRRRLESHRPWTKEDETLLHDPKLFDLEYDTYKESSSSEYHPDKSTEVSEENMSDLTPLVNDPEDTILDLESENAIEAGAENISQQLTFTSSPNFPGIMADPFLGTRDDMSDVCEWEDLDSSI